MKTSQTRSTFVQPPSATAWARCGAASTWWQLAKDRLSACTLQAAVAQKSFERLEVGPNTSTQPPRCCRSLHSANFNSRALGFRASQSLAKVVRGRRMGFMALKQLH